MSLRQFRLGIAALLLLTAFAATPLAQAQDEANLAATADAAMKRMVDGLSAALVAGDTGAARANVNAAISAGTTAVAALQALQDLTTNDVVRSRSKAALDQTSSAVNKARAALSASGDEFRSLVNAALAEVQEAVVEFAPVLPLVESAPVALPRAGGLTLDRNAALGLALLSLIMTMAGMTMRRLQARLA